MTIIAAGMSIGGAVNASAVSGVALSIAVNLLSKLSPQTQSAAAAVAGTIGASASSGAIFGAILGRSTTGALTGAISGGTGSAILSTGPIGWVVLGYSEACGSNREKVVTLDCWKAVLHDLSTEPSNGMLIKDVVLDSRIKDVTVTPMSESMPEVILENIWSEKFQVKFLLLEGTKLVAHATPY